MLFELKNLCIAKLYPVVPKDLLQAYIQLFSLNVKFVHGHLNFARSLPSLTGLLHAHTNLQYGSQTVVLGPVDRKGLLRKDSIYMYLISC
jgi:hypothetical protein